VCSAPIDSTVGNVERSAVKKTTAPGRSRAISLDEARGKNLDIDIDIGTQLLIKLGTSNRQFSSVIVGRKPWEYIVIRTSDGTEILGHLHEGNRIEVSYVHNGLGLVFGFRSFIQGIVRKPVQLILVDYPDHIETHNVRKEPRIGCFYLVRAEVHGEIYNGVVTNINTGGCAFTFHPPTLSSDYAIKIQDVMTSNNKDIFPDEIPKLQCSICPGEKAKLHFEQLAGSIPISGTFKHVSLDRGKIVCGMEFENLDSAVSEKILEYLNSVRQHIGLADVC